MTVPIDEDNTIIPPPPWLKPSINTKAVGAELEHSDFKASTDSKQLEVMKLMDVALDKSSKKSAYVDQLTGAGNPFAELSPGVVVKGLQSHKRRKSRKPSSLKKKQPTRRGRVVKRVQKTRRRVGKRKAVKRTKKAPRKSVKKNKRVKRKKTVKKTRGKKSNTLF